ncbi:MAG: molybdopterin molybdotransferase MoeA [Ancalomicrobiaceae bacterium]|nr:molybdopterin molybdotransferase MoeA [Ancalomicrobiaceae bacterium]
MALISVDEARAHVLDGAGCAAVDEVELMAASGRTLAEDLIARRTQPPFEVSAMDGYAVRSADVARCPAELVLIGAVPAGYAFEGIVGPGEAVRIFTGAPVPAGADAVLIQENTTIPGEGRVIALEPVAEGRNIRRAGLDFTAGDVLLRRGHRLEWRDVALAAAMNYPTVQVARRPRVGILATGDELAKPGAVLGPAQIVASNTYAIAAYVETKGAEAVDLGTVPDDLTAIVARIRYGLGLGIDVLVTLGGASVGDHDLTHQALAASGATLNFWKVALRPGKPLMSARIGATRIIGMPGNPVSCMVGAVLFLGPLIGALLGRDVIGEPAEEPAILGAALKENDSRSDYLRASLVPSPSGLPVATAFERQDSAMLSRFVAADCLIVRPAHAPPAQAGAPCRIVRL